MADPDPRRSDRAVVAIPSTRTIRGLASEVELGPEDGMPTACALSLDNISTIRTSFLTSRLTVLGPDGMHAVCRARTTATACA